ncbi:hypothetical protein AB0M28_26340 [Streptomyces sp. NPDC051940]|uniref:hypothetical protein n=1 Tax=Streptomyces sp. NPDC051940 TaxID=3155675 RepID=UPI003433AD5D
MTLYAAAVTADITPPPGHLLGGYVARTGPATGTADPLRATLVWLSGDADPGVLWLTVDAVAVDTGLAARLAVAAARAAAIPAERVLVCASHTHAAPVGWAGEISPSVPGVREPELETALADAVAYAAAALPAARVPARLTWTVVDAPGVGANRHRADGPHDTTTGVLAVYAAEGPASDAAEGPAPDPAQAPAPDAAEAPTPDRPLALLLDHASHPTVLGPDNLRYSADWPGAARRALAAALGGCHVAFLQGAAGDASPRFVRRGRDAAELDRIGGLLAAPVLHALRAARPLPDAVPALRRSTAAVPVRRLPEPAEAARTVARARTDLAAVADADSPGARLARTTLEGAETVERLRAAALPAELTLPVGVVTLAGGPSWLHLPVELFASLGLRLRGGDPHTRVIGYTDGYFGYVADADGVTAGCYESLTSYFDTAGAEALLGAADDALTAARSRR